MGLPTIIFLVVLTVILIPTIKGIAEGSSKTNEEKKEEARKLKTREDEGIFGTIGRIFLGDEFVDKRKTTDAFSRQQEEKKIKAKEAGFSNVKDFEEATRFDDSKLFFPKDKFGNPIISTESVIQKSSKGRFGGKKRRF